jgi:GMP synthase (glutamine-hydrolysing)
VSPRILVVEHQASCPPALFGEWLEEAGAELDVCRPWAGDALPALTSYDGLLVLGGEMGAGDDDRVPWLAPLKELLREAASTGLPTLGICLGHQLVAVALGGEVRRNPLGQSVGVVATGWTAERADDPLTGGLTGTRGIHWNNDVVTRVPDGTVVLAESEAGEVQVARFAPAVWGVQLHPEADGRVVLAWAESDRADHLERGLDQEAVLAEVDAARGELDAAWRPLAHRFAEIAGERR